MRMGCLEIMKVTTRTYPAPVKVHPDFWLCLAEKKESGSRCWPSTGNHESSEIAGDSKSEILGSWILPPGCGASASTRLTIPSALHRRPARLPHRAAHLD